MEKIDFQIELDEHQKERRSQLIESLQKDPSVSRFLKNNPAAWPILQRTPTRFVRFASCSKECAMCQGLAYCTMKLRGQSLQLRLDEDGFLNEEYRPCRYQDEKLSRLTHRQNFSVSHMQEADYLISVEKLAQSLGREPKSYIEAYGAAMGTIDSPSGALLFGQPGTGKTTLMMALANFYAKTGKRVAFVRVPLLMSELKENLSDDEFRRTVLGRMRYADVLFLDDFGSESATVWTRDEILFPLLDERMNAKRKTYFASNIRPSELESRYTVDGGSYSAVAARRLMERVRTLAKPVELSGNSRRRQPGSSPSSPSSPSSR